jgi:hypothetical protein
VEPSRYLPRLTWGVVCTSTSNVPLRAQTPGSPSACAGPVGFNSRGSVAGMAAANPAEATRPWSPATVAFHALKDPCFQTEAGQSTNRRAAFGHSGRAAPVLPRHGGIALAVILLLCNASTFLRSASNDGTGCASA